MSDRPRQTEPGPATPSAANREQAPTTEQLRDDIDSGRTHDKVAHSDPAAAPLGSDDEAAGAPPMPEQVSTARRHEASRGVPEQPSASRAAPQTGGRSTATIVWVITAVVVVAIFLALIF